MIHSLTSLVVLLVGIYLVGLSVVSLLHPARAARFLTGFARSAAAHYLELTLRLTAGAAILFTAPKMLLSGYFVVAGWVLVATTICLCAVPWRWHRRFAEWSVPYAVRNLRLVAVASLVLGAAVLVSLFFGGGIEQS
jgi:hypothetical protein